MFINCQTLTLFELLTPFFTFFIFTLKHPWRRKSLLKNTCCTFCIYDWDVTKPSFLRNKFWAVIHTLRHRMSLPSNIQLTHRLQDFPYFLTTDNPPVFISSPIVGRLDFRVPEHFRVPERFRVIDRKKLNLPDPTRQNVLPAHPECFPSKISYFKRAKL